MQLDSLSSRKSRERQRLDIEDILNASPSAQERVADAKIPGPPMKQGTRGERVLKHLGKIIGREGKGLFDYFELAKLILFSLNLLVLWQVSPDASKEFRRLSTRINKKKGKR